MKKKVLTEDDYLEIAKGYAEEPPYTYDVILPSVVKDGWHYFYCGFSEFGYRGLPHIIKINTEGEYFLVDDFKERMWATKEAFRKEKENNSSTSLQ